MLTLDTQAYTGENIDRDVTPPVPITSNNTTYTSMSESLKSWLFNQINQILNVLGESIS
jgi:hypothetical protein